ncbi:hypothetical protein JYU34_001934 [Plutella xylostella]|uniref:Uncharacterized protein n=1 Tax=Plutella xylostella TaxID=51655 RepID=A0ABQ7R544_PLUXY|nr:hypothetical protein JYU34_001934 [Plutella xylostella]
MWYPRGRMQLIRRTGCRGAAAAWRRCRCDVVALWLRCGCDVVVLHRWSMTTAKCGTCELDYSLSIQNIRPTTPRGCGVVVAVVWLWYV